MSTTSQSSKVQVLDKASADAEILGQKLHNALARMYFTVRKDEDLADDFAEAHQADVELRAIMRGSAALSACRSRGKGGT
jgi:hypothetical protein